MEFPSRMALFAGALFFALAGSAIPAVAQPIVTGTVVDSDDQVPLVGVNVVATHLAEDSTRTGVATDSGGTFRLSLPAGTYRLRLSYVGYMPNDRTLTVAGEPMDVGRVALESDPLWLDELVVEDVQERVVLRGDTTAFNADAFAVTAGASAEELVSKLPGVVIQDGVVLAQGEEVRRVLVDGEEFFGDDALAALRNLPAEVIQEVEIYDRQSDQARFSGFDDGNEERTINVRTRAGMQRGQFGTVYGGYGTDERYNAGGAVNFFNGSRRIAVVGMTNNVNQQNFGSEDLLGVLNAAGGSGGRGGGGNSRDYRIGERGGINETNALGINYVDRWGERMRINGSYFVNLSGNDTDARLQREYILSEGSNQLYSETTDAGSSNANHRLNLRIEADLSESTQLTVTPRVSMQRNSTDRSLHSFSALTSGLPLSLSASSHQADNLGFSSNTNVLLRHRFAARGRTISASINVGLNGRDGTTEQDVRNEFFHHSAPAGTGLDEFDGLVPLYDDADLIADSTDLYRRRTDRLANDRSLSVRFSYTEPIGARGRLQFTYSPSVSRNRTDQDALRLDEATGAFTLSDSMYASESAQRVFGQRGGVDFQIRNDRIRATVGLDLRNEEVVYEQLGRRAFEVDRSFLFVLPSANVRWNVSESSNLNVSYRPSTSAPRVNQLRDVIDEDNPRFLSSGNPDLRPSHTHRLNTRFRATQVGGGRVITASLNVQATRDYVGTAAIVAENEMLLAGGIRLNRGSQFSYPVNLDGRWNVGTSLNYGRPVGFLKSNANTTLGLSYTTTPSLINDLVNRARAVQVDGRLFLGSNVSEQLDFSVSYRVNYTTISNTLAAARDRAYVRHRAGVRFTWLPWTSLALRSDLNLSHFTGLAAGVDPTMALWNVGIGYKFLAQDLAEIRLTVTDLLGQNTSVNRNVTGHYIEDAETRALGRYVMLNLVYRVRNFGP